jgi:hypothetical protein
MANYRINDRPPFWRPCRLWADAQATDMAFAVELAVVSRLERLAQILNRSRTVFSFRSGGLERLIVEM